MIFTRNANTFADRAAAVFGDLLDAAEEELGRPLTEDETDSVLNALFDEPSPTENRWRSVGGGTPLRLTLAVNRCDCEDREGADPEHQCEQCAAEAAKRKRAENALPSDSADVTPEKACQILRDGKVHGQELTEKQRGFFGAICGKRTENHQSGKHDQSAHGKRSSSSGDKSGGGAGKGSARADYQDSSAAASRASKDTEVQGFRSPHGDATREAARLTKKSVKLDTTAAHRTAGDAHQDAAKMHESEFERWLRSSAHDAGRMSKRHQAARTAHEQAAEGHYARAAELRRDQDKAAMNTLWLPVAAAGRTRVG